VLGDTGSDERMSELEEDGARPAEQAHALGVEPARRGKARRLLQIQSAGSSRTTRVGSPWRESTAR
jgi:hypothetical protein